MIDAISGYAQSRPASSSVVTPPSAASAAAATAPDTSIPRPNRDLLQAMQASRQSAVLLSSLVAPSANYAPFLSALSFVPPALSAPQRPGLALLQAMQSVVENSSLLSALNNGGGALGPAGQAQTRAAQQAVNGAQGRSAYLTELQAQRQAERQSILNTWMYEWFA
jgi:hypothetical protein